MPHCSVPTCLVPALSEPGLTEPGARDGAQVPVARGGKSSLGQGAAEGGTQNEQSLPAKKVKRAARPDGGDDDDGGGRPKLSKKEGRLKVGRRATASATETSPAEDTPERPLGKKPERPRSQTPKAAQKAAQTPKVAKRRNES